MKRKIPLIVSTAMLSMMLAIPSYAGTFPGEDNTANSQTWTAQSDNGILQVSGGQWVQGKSGNWYYFTVASVPLMNTLAEIDGQIYFFGSDGQIMTGWQQVGENWYYFFTPNDAHGAPTGAAARNTEIDGYKINQNGIWKEREENPYLQVLQQAYGTETPSLQQAFNWCASMTYVRQDTPPQLGVAYLAQHGLSTHSGNCYIMASTFCEMARALGYECHVMTGQVPLRRGGLGPHSWVEINIDGTWYICDPDFTEETGRNGFMIHYGKSGTWRYQNYTVMPDTMA